MSASSQTTPVEKKATRSKITTFFNLAFLEKEASNLTSLEKKGYSLKELEDYSDSMPSLDSGFRAISYARPKSGYESDDEKDEKKTIGVFKVTPYISPAGGEIDTVGLALQELAYKLIYPEKAPYLKPRNAIKNGFKGIFTKYQRELTNLVKYSQANKSTTDLFGAGIMFVMAALTKNHDLRRTNIVIDQNQFMYCIDCDNCFVESLALNNGLQLDTYNTKITTADVSAWREGLRAPDIKCFNWVRQWINGNFYPESKSLFTQTERMDLEINKTILIFLILPEEFFENLIYQLGDTHEYIEKIIKEFQTKLQELDAALEEKNFKEFVTSKGAEQFVNDIIPLVQKYPSCKGQFPAQDIENLDKLIRQKFASIKSKVLEVKVSSSSTTESKADSKAESNSSNATTTSEKTTAPSENTTATSEKTASSSVHKQSVFAVSNTSCVSLVTQEVSTTSSTVTPVMSSQASSS